MSGTRAEVSLIDGKLIYLITAPPEGGDWLCPSPRAASKILKNSLASQK